MAYVFTQQEVASFRFEKSGDVESLTLNGVNGSEDDANVIVNGIKALLEIGGIDERYNATQGYRTVRQDVDDDE